MKFHASRFTNAKLADAIGNDDTNNEVLVCGLFPSRVAFARALVEENLTHHWNWPTSSAVDRYLATYGSIMSAERAPEGVEPGKVYVCIGSGTDLEYVPVGEAMARRYAVRCDMWETQPQTLRSARGTLESTEKLGACTREHEIIQVAP
jgi:hypothetical protein